MIVVGFVAGVVLAGYVPAVAAFPKKVVDFVLSKFKKDSE